MGSEKSPPSPVPPLPATPPPAIALRDVTKYFYKDDTRITALARITFDVRPGSFISILGPSGCGKSTILNLIAGLEAPSEGSIYYGATHVNHLPRELSGGMRKRAALAQTLVYARDTVLMDEPFGALDFQMRLQLQAELLNIWSTERRTIVFVTHDIEEAIALSDEIIILSRRPGKIRDTVGVDLPRPRDPVTVRFEPRFHELYKRVWSQVEPPEGAPVRPGGAPGSARA